MTAAVAHATLVLAEDDDADAAFARPTPIGERWPFTRARVLLVHGMRLRRHGGWPTRASRCARPRPRFAALGATPWAERAQRELAATAETAHRATATWTGSRRRSSRSRGMAARGMTNPAIAADLALSPRTVGHHLARIFPKLEVCSRAGIGAALERHGY